MRTHLLMLCSIATGLAAVGCGPTKPFDGPTVDAFTGRVVHEGKPVSFEGQEVELKLFHETGQSFGIPLKPDGTFQIGWMPLGKYATTLVRKPNASGKAGKSGGQKTHTVPGGLTIEEGKTEYQIALGKDWKP